MDRALGGQKNGVTGGSKNKPLPGTMPGTAPMTAPAQKAKDYALGVRKPVGPPKVVSKVREYSLGGRSPDDGSLGGSKLRQYSLGVARGRGVKARR